MADASLYLKPVTAVLGPTNTGKTHYALERMAAHETGMIGLPLRLLAREVFDKFVAVKGARAVALITGEEKIIPPAARYFICTVEAMPLERTVSFMAIDEVQLAADPERGRVFTERLLHARGTHETLFLGAATMASVLKKLFPDIGFIGRERFSALTYAGPIKISRLPRRTAIVAFSAEAVYEIAEHIRRQRGGAAIIMGGLSPRTRNAQAALYQSGEVDYLVATDAIGMGLNMDINHIAFAATRKYDGRRARFLRADELAQIGGRAGRHIKDGSFGVTGACQALEEDIVEAIENHQFDPVRALQWRAAKLDFSNLSTLFLSLEKRAPLPALVRAPLDEDELALRQLAKRADIKQRAQGKAGLKLLWDVCQIPDFRKISLEQHVELLGDIFTQLIDRGRVSQSWLTPQIERLDRLDGDVDMISQRIAHIRTWTYLSHRRGWIDNAPTWQERARAIEDRLSDRLHTLLMQRFIDRRSSFLIKRLKDDAPLLGGVTPDGEVIVEGEFVGRLQGFQFILDPTVQGPHQKTVRYAAMQALKPELANRAARLAHCDEQDLRLEDDGSIWWQQGEIARLVKGATPFTPLLRLTITDSLPTHAIAKVENHLHQWLKNKMVLWLAPLLALNEAVNQPSDDKANTLSPQGRAIGFRLVENFGACSRGLISEEVKALDQTERGKLRKLGVRFGEYTIHIPALLKPANAKMLTLLWALWHAKPLSDFEQPKPGLTSFPLKDEYPHAFYYASGYRPSGTRAVRIDMLERLAELIRKARQDSPHREGFEADARMMSLVGCSGEEFESILKSLNLRKNMVTLDAAEIAKRLSRKAQEQADKQAQTKPEPLTKKAAENIAADMAKDNAATEKALQANVKEQAGDEAPSPAPIDATNGRKEKTEAETESTTEAAPKTASEQAEKQQEEKIELTLWRMAPRFAKPRHKSPRKPADSQHAKGKKPFNKKGKPGQRKGAPHGKQAMRTYTAGPTHKKGKQIDPDSPFAVLAGLKEKD